MSGRKGWNPKSLVCETEVFFLSGMIGHFILRGRIPYVKGIF